jgi:hypothetical protein
MTNELVKRYWPAATVGWDGVAPGCRSGFTPGFANFVQCLFAKDVGVALAILRKFNDLSCNCLSDTLVTVSGAQGYAGQLDGYTQDALSLSRVGHH